MGGNDVWCTMDHPDDDAPDDDSQDDESHFKNRRLRGTMHLDSLQIKTILLFHSSALSYIGGSFRTASIVAAVQTTPTIIIVVAKTDTLMT